MPAALATLAAIGLPDYPFNDFMELKSLIEEPCLDPREMTPADWQRAGFVPNQPPVLKAIRAKCLDCCAGQAGEVRLCPAAGCNLWPYRMGTNPFRAPASDAQREAGKQAAARRSRGGGSAASAF